VGAGSWIKNIYGISGEIRRLPMIMFLLIQFSIFIIIGYSGSEITRRVDHEPLYSIGLCIRDSAFLLLAWGLVAITVRRFRNFIFYGWSLYTVFFGVLCICWIPYILRSHGLDKVAQISVFYILFLNI